MNNRCQVVAILPLISFFVGQQLNVCAGAFDQQPTGKDVEIFDVTKKANEQKKNAETQRIENARKQKAQVRRHQLQLEEARRVERIKCAVRSRQLELKNEEVRKAKREEEFAREQAAAQAQADLKRDQEAQRLARDRRERAENDQKIEQERLERLARERKEQTQRKAEAENRRNLQAFLDHIRVIGFVGDKAILCLPDNQARGLIVGANDSVGPLRLAAVSNSELTFAAQGQQFSLPVNTAMLLGSQSTSGNFEDSWYASFLHDVNRRLENECGSQLSNSVRFTILKCGEPANMQVDPASEEAQVVESAAPFRPLLPSFLKSVDLAVTLGRPATARIVSLEIVEARPKSQH